MTDEQWDRYMFRAMQVFVGIIAVSMYVLLGLTIFATASKQ